MNRIIRRYGCFSILLWIFFCGSGSHAQILGYPLPGSTNYPDSDGCRLDKIFLDNDRAFNLIIADETTNSALLASRSFDMPSIIRFDLDNNTKTGKIDLDNGMSAVTCGCLCPLTREIWFGTDGYLVVIDADRFILSEIIPIDAALTIGLVMNSQHDQILCLVTGDVDTVLTIDPLNRSIQSHPIPPFSNTFSDMQFDCDNQVLYILTDTSPPAIIAVDLNDFSVCGSQVLPVSQSAVTFTLNEVRDELYIAIPGSPASIHRLSLPDLFYNGSVELESEERPRGFMTCDSSGNYLLVNDSDGTSGLIRINTYLFQRLDRMDFPSSPFPTCCARYEDMLLIATEHSPAALISVDPDSFQMLNQYTFPDNAGTAGALIFGLDPERAFVSVLNNGFARLIKLGGINGHIESVYDYPDIHGHLTMNAGPDQDNNSFWIEEDANQSILSISLETGELLQRQSLQSGQICKGLIYDQENDGILMLTENAIFFFDPDELNVIDSVSLDQEILPARAFTLDAENNRLLVGGGLNTNKFWTYSIIPLGLSGTLDLDGQEKNVVAMSNDAVNGNTYLAVSSTPYKIKCFDQNSSEFTGTIDLPFNGNNLRSISYQTAFRQLYVLDKNTSTTLYRLDTDSFQWLESIPLSPGEYVFSCASSGTYPYCYAPMSGSHAAVIRFGSTCAHAIHGSWANLQHPARIVSLKFYAHTGGNLVRFAVYSQNMMSCWQSDFIENTIQNDWLEVDIEQGTPSELELPAGQYLLAFQISDDEDTPSATCSAVNSGLRSMWHFSEFPSVVIDHEQTAILWSIYADCLILPGSPTPTPGESPTPSPTSTSSPVPPTRTPTPTLTPVISPTPRPGSGVELSISRNIFQPGDTFWLDARYANMDPSPRNLLLYIILDVYGRYWFGPSWSQSPDAYVCHGVMGERTSRILDFEWPEVEDSADGLRFWGGIVEEGAETIFGYYDYVEFEYRGIPKTPTPTVTPSGTPDQTPEPTIPSPTPTSGHHQIRVDYITDDPMHYAGEYCETGEVYCFAPERMGFCSGWQSVLHLNNQGSSIASIDLHIEGFAADDYQLESDIVILLPGESYDVMVRFCPTLPPDQLKMAGLHVTWGGGDATLEIKGWCVAG
ncbi:hypothetical protein JW823_09415 [bacterium]|nr:hypothetical protein [candidate division CSSED10-310 bacterium]